MSLDAEFVSLFRCPKCRGKLVHHKSPHGFACADCALFFAADDDLPNFLIEEAKPWPLVGAVR